MPFCKRTLLLPLLETSQEVLSDVALRPSFAFCWISSTDAKRWTLNPILNLGMIQKSCGARSWEYGVWVTGAIWYFSQGSAVLPRSRDRVHWHRTRFNFFLHGHLPQAHMPQPVAICCRGYTESIPAHSNYLALTGNSYLNTTKFQGLFDPCSYYIDIYFLL